MRPRSLWSSPLLNLDANFTSIGAGRSPTFARLCGRSLCFSVFRTNKHAKKYQAVELQHLNWVQLIVNSPVVMIKTWDDSDVLESAVALSLYVSDSHKEQDECFVLPYRYSYLANFLYLPSPLLSALPLFRPQLTLLQPSVAFSVHV